MDRVVITGGAGFIGSHVVDNLRKRGIAVTVFDRHLGPFHRNDLEFKLGDVKDRQSVMDVVERNDGIIHLAAVLGTQETVTNASNVTSVNIQGSLNVFDACKTHKKRGVYIAVGNHWMNNPYSISKTTAERLAIMYNREFGTQIAVVRGLNAYGPRQKPKPVRKVMPNFVIPALGGKELVIYGSGNQIMDMIYVEDLAEILVRALVLNHGVFDRPMEAGMGLDTRINELADLVLRTAGSGASIRHVSMRPGEIPESVVKGDIETLKCLDMSLKQMVPLDEGVKRTVDWYKMNPQITQ